MKKWWGVVLVMLLTACDQGVDGAYRDAMSVSTYRFQPEGTVSIEMAGVQHQGRYIRNGNALEILLSENATVLQFTLGKDGALSGPMGVVLKKVDD